MKLTSKQYVVLMVVCLILAGVITCVDTIINKTSGAGSFIALAPAMLGWFMQPK